MDRPNIVTERLILRRPNDGDASAIASVAGDWEVARRLARVPHPYTVGDATFFLQEIVPSEWIWAITLHDADELIGVVGLTPEDANSCVLGYWLSPAHWGRGIMSEAAEAVVRFGFDALRLHSLTSNYFEDNPASARVLEKLGFGETGRAMLRSVATAREAPSVNMRLSNAGGSLANVEPSGS